MSQGSPAEPVPRHSGRTAAPVREFHVASSVTTLTMSNVADIVFDNATSRPDHVALRRRVDGDVARRHRPAFADEVMAAAKGFIAAGIQSGDRVAVMSKTRYEWTLVDFALFTVGAVVVPIYETSSAEQVDWILSDSGARGVGRRDRRAQGDRRIGARAGARPRACLDVDDGAIDSLVSDGAEVADDDVTKRRQAVTLDDTASLIYTSGTTGRPKGCQLLHRSFIAECTELPTSSAASSTSRPPPCCSCRSRTSSAA